MIDILLACCEERLSDIDINWLNKKSLCIVLCSKGYPENYEKNIEIKNIDKINQNNNNFLFHAGTKKENNKIYSIGGRVLNFVSISDDFKNAKKNVIKNLNDLNWSDGFYRKDIGYKVIK